MPVAIALVQCECKMAGVVAYESSILRGPQKTMEVYEKELVAVIHALSSWKHYLLGADFVVQTDHQTLRYFLTETKLS